MKNLLFVDDEPRILQGLQRQLYSMRNEWKMTFVDSGAKALEFLAANPVDVTVTDMMMPGMDGAQLLTEVMKNYPKTVRIVLSGHADRESVLRLVGPAHQYLSKPCEAEELRGAISRAFALRDLLTNEQLKQLATRLRSLPTLPTLHAQLTEELRKEEPSMEAVAQIIAKDIGMTSKILQLVNSAFFGLPQPLSSPQEAVMYLGMATVRSLVLSIQVFSQFDPRIVKHFSIDGLAQHCWMTGAMARRIAEFEHCSSKVDDQCFLAGLLHDVGQLVLASGLPEEYARVLETAKAENKSILEVEKAVFGATHAEVGAYLLGLWGLPNPIIEAVAFHHRPADAPVKGFSPLVAVYVGSLFAHEQSSGAQVARESKVDEAALASHGLEGKLEAWRAHCFDDGL
ncbi:MAG: HDOD domain-containing protein [Akkermansiaceae bacterium]|nr:HDOD domain-containing protein [Verrucomicrobiales bacterium]